MYEATRLFASNLNPHMAQRFYNLVLLPRIRDDIQENKKVGYHLFLHPTVEPPSHLTVELPSHPTVELPSHPTVELPSHPPVELPSHPSVELPSHPSVELPSHPTVELPSLPRATQGHVQASGVLQRHYSSPLRGECVRTAEVTGLFCCLTLANRVDFGLFFVSKMFWFHPPPSPPRTETATSRKPPSLPPPWARLLSRPRIQVGGGVKRRKFRWRILAWRY